MSDRYDPRNYQRDLEQRELGHREWRDREWRARGSGYERPYGERGYGETRGEPLGERDRSFGEQDRDYGAYPQMTRGGSDRAGGGFGGPGSGGYGQQVLNSQWGGGGYGPMTQGANYSQGGSRFGPAGGYDDVDSGYREGHRGDAYAARHEPSRYDRDLHATGAHDHDPSYRHWRDTQLGTHDRDYSHWRAEQARRYDEEYAGWRNERHGAFSKEFETWRSSRAGQPAPVAGQTGEAHGGNPTLGDIADGGVGRSRHEARHVSHVLEQDAKAAEHEQHKAEQQNKH
jgi:hypothetical protein